jgi:hypothetical protein
LARSTTRTRAAERERSRLGLWIAVGALVLVGGGWLAFRLLGGPKHAYEVEWPENRPTGEPLRVERALRAGDRFATRIETKTRILLSSDYADVEQGMKVDAKLEVAHEVSAREGGLRSTYRWKLLDASSDVRDPSAEAMQAMLWRVLGDSQTPFVLVRERDATGRVLADSPAPSGAAAVQAMALDLLLSGLSDPSLDYLPRGRDVRLGEVWRLFDEVADLPGMERAVRKGTATEGEGFPPLIRAGVVKAEAVEPGAGGETLRLRVVFTVSMEGDTRPPAPPGRISLAGKGEGLVRVSLRTGLPVETDVRTEMQSSLVREGLAPAERVLRQTIRSKAVP